MKAAVVHSPGKTPVYTDFPGPIPSPGSELLSVTAAALTHLTKGRASGAHYSAEGGFPLVPGVDGVGITEAGRRVYFVLPPAPYGAMAERVPVPAAQCIELPAGLDDITAAALANPGMSAYAALGERAKLQPGETVLVNGATGIAGRLAVQIAKYMGAARVIATGRDQAALEELKHLGADVVIPFQLDGSPEGEKEFEAALKQHFSHGIDVVVDYLWGKSAETILIAIARAVETTAPVRFVQVGSASADNVQLPGAALRSSPIVLMGSGLKSVPLPGLLRAIQNTFAAALPANLQIPTQAVPLAQVEATWDAPGKSRIVFTVG
jgi:NADPH:quinone reductase-like Zn-dependent oxidoreductase